VSVDIGEYFPDGQATHSAAPTPDVKEYSGCLTKQLVHTVSEKVEYFPKVQFWQVFSIAIVPPLQPSQSACPGSEIQLW